MSKYCVIEIRLVTHVQNAEIARVVAEDACEENDDQSADITWLKCIDG